MSSYNSIPVLLDALENSDVGIRNHAASELFSLVRQDKVSLTLKQEILCWINYDLDEPVIEFGDNAKPILVDLLNSVPGVVERAAIILGKMKEPEAAEKLVDMCVLGGQEWTGPAQDRRKEARKALVKIGKPAVPYLMQAMRDGIEAAKKEEHESVMTQSTLTRFGHPKLAEVLGKIGVTQEQLDELIDLSRTSEAWFEKTLIRTILGNLKDSRATDYLVADLIDTDASCPDIKGGHEILTATIKALANIGDKKATDALTNFMLSEELQKKASTALIASFDPRFVPVARLSKYHDHKEWAKTIAYVLLESDSPHLSTNHRVLSLLLLGKTNEVSKLGDAAFEGCILGLENRNAYVRTIAVISLGEIGSRKAVSYLFKALTDSHSSVRINAVGALGTIGSRRVVRKLIVLLDDEDVKIRLEAIKQLGAIGDKRAVEPLLKQLRDEELFSCALTNLEIIADRKIIGPLITTLDHVPEHKRERIVELLGKLGDETVLEPLFVELDGASTNYTICILEALGKVGNDKAVSSLITALQNDAPVVRTIAIRNLVALSRDYVLEQVVDAYIVGRIPEETMFKILLDIAKVKGPIAIHGKLFGSLNDLDSHYKQKFQEEFGQVYLRIIHALQAQKKSVAVGKLSEGIPKPPGQSKGRKGLVRVQRVGVLV